jgi:hypothetical protein
MDLKVELDHLGVGGVGGGGGTLEGYKRGAKRFEEYTGTRRSEFFEIVIDVVRYLSSSLLFNRLQLKM